MDKVSEPTELLSRTTEIVAAYARSHTVSASELPGLISSVFRALHGTGTVDEPGPSAEILTPAVPVRKSVMPDYIVCLEDGKKLKLLKRHLAQYYSLTPTAYRQRWGLPADYPMIAPAYAAQRSALAKSSGLGRKPIAAPEPEPVAPPPARRVHMRKRAKTAE